MRALFHEELELISEQLVLMSQLSAAALERATKALMTADLSLAEQVISDDQHIDAVRRDVDNRSIDVLARQQPVATDLRQMVTTLRISSDFERAGDLARHVAKLARLRYPSKAVPAEMSSIFTEMAEVGQSMMLRAGEILLARDAHGASELMQADDAMDRLHREVFRTMLGAGWEHSTQRTVDMTLLSRYYERFADHSVSVALRVVYLATGVWHDEQMPGAHEHTAGGEIPREGR